MVKKKRLSSASGVLETCQQNGMIIEGVSHSKEGVKRTCCNNVSDINLCQNTRSKQKIPVDNSSVSLELNGDETDEKHMKCSVQVTRTSNRTPKPSSRSISSPTQSSRKSGSSRCTSIPDQVKTRRSWELWSVEDKNSFFEALSEYGKDFESIQHYICQKNKKKNHPPHMIKNKDQVRHFYYRTWHKISKYLDIGDDVKKQTQELYGLINYGELRKKIGGRLDEKSSQKLNELILKGATTVRLKGKNLRVKTPVCRALKKLIHVNDPKEEQWKFPVMVPIEFQPQTNAAWTHVQSIAHNPRLRMTVSLQRRLSSILNFLQTRWKSHRVKQKENVSSSETSLLQENDKLLRVLPRKDATITLVSLQTSSENLTNTHVCLQNYLENVLQKNAVCCSKDYVKTRSQRSCSRSDGKCGDEKLPSGDSKISSEINILEENVINEIGPLPDDHLNLKSDQDSDKLSLETTDMIVDLSSEKNVSEKESRVSNIGVNSVHSSMVMNSEEQLNMIRHGWNIKEAGALTVGEIYVMLGNPNKIVLEYCWETDNESKITDKTTPNCKSLRQHLVILSKLMHVATTTLSDLSKTKQEKQFSSAGNTCQCGHTCPATLPAFKLPLLAGPSAFRNGTKNQKNLNSKNYVNRDNVSKADSSVDIAASKGQGDSIHGVQNKSFLSVQQKKPLTTSEAAFKEQLDRFLPVNKKARGSIRKSVVVQRELPLLPKTFPTHSMMTLRIVPTASQLAGSFVPVISNSNLSPNVAAYSKIVKLPSAKAAVPTTIIKSLTRNEGNPNVVPAKMTLDDTVNEAPNSVLLSSAADQSVKTSANAASILKTEVQAVSKNSGISLSKEPFLKSTELGSNAPASIIQEVSSEVNELPLSSRSSLPNISSLLDISMPEYENFQMEGIGVSLGNSEKLLDISLSNSNSTFLDVPVTSSTLLNSSVYKGASIALENVWLNGEVEDLSLSSLLGNLESPMKQTSAGISTLQEGGGTSDSIARLSTDVDNHFHTMMNESSLDYISKFADLAAQIAETSGNLGK